MAVTLYDAVIPGYLNMLKNLQALLDKAAAHAKSTGVEPESYMDTRLAPDMHPLVRQVQMASDTAKGGAARLGGVTAPSMADTETTWAELSERIAKTVAFIQTIDAAAVNGDESRIIELPIPDRVLKFTARDYAFNFALPNFHFHVVTAYALLRHQGVPLGKTDYLSGGQGLAA